MPCRRLQRHDSSPAQPLLHLPREAALPPTAWWRAAHALHAALQNWRPCTTPCLIHGCPFMAAASFEAEPPPAVLPCRHCITSSRSGLDHQQQVGSLLGRPSHRVCPATSSWPAAVRAPQRQQQPAWAWPHLAPLLRKRCIATGEYDSAPDPQTSLPCRHCSTSSRLALARPPTRTGSALPGCWPHTLRPCAARQ